RCKQAIVVGCNDLARYSGSFENPPYSFTTDDEAKCRSSCKSGAKNVVAGQCNNVGCCQTSISKGMIQYQISHEYESNHTTMSSYNPCGYSFLADQESFKFRGVSDLNDPNFINRTVYDAPLVLVWVISNDTCANAKLDPETYACKENTTCVNADESGIGGYRCTCAPGYKGHPYLSPGCSDINKCTDLDSSPCSMKCTNTPGNYTCSCPTGYVGDGRVDGTSCKRQFPTIKVALGVGFGSLFLLIVGSSLFLARRRRIMKVATKNFKDEQIIGRGGYGTVYKGILLDRQIIAVKKSKFVDENQIEQFINELNILGQTRHPNVVRLLGCCLEVEVPLLVDEFISNGTLFDRIHNKDGTSWYSWSNCLRIAMDSANALAYIHSIPIIHRDIKSSNILLDDSYTAKISDFGASRLIPLHETHLSTVVQGTLGYLDPEYFFSSQLPEKSDVYSFGVVLAELLTRIRPLSPERENEEQIQNLATYFIKSMHEDNLFNILDSQLIMEATKEQLISISKLVIRCLSIKGEERPTMKEVAMDLGELWKQTTYIIPSENQEGTIFIDSL
uniref:Uncharacterized protein n=1 Tax=Chenopodium quinoa TaxID=63459 RepID=A0A803NDX1_CHEQI